MIVYYRPPLAPSRTKTPDIFNPPAMGEGPTTIEPEDRPSRRACVPDPLIPPLNDPNHLVDLIAEITGRPKPEVVERLWALLSDTKKKLDDDLKGKALDAAKKFKERFVQSLGEDE